MQKSKLRNNLAMLFRAMPDFRGKASLGVSLGERLTDINNNQECIVTVQMKDGSVMQLDVRSMTERWAVWTGRYDHEIIARLTQCLRPGSVVFDVGANVGFYTIALGRRLKNLGGTLYAFEPVPSNFARIESGVLQNRLSEVVIPVNVALGDREGQVQFSMDTRNNASTGNAALVKEGEIKEEASTARMTTLDQLTVERNIKICDLIKVDIEGNEYMFLKGGASFLSRQRPIIYGEFNPGWMSDYGHSFLDIAALVRPWGYRFFQQSDRYQFTEIKEPQAGIQDVLLVPEGTAPELLTRMGVVRQ